MSEDQPVETPLREVGIDLVPPYPKPLTVGHKIQRVWSLIFGKHQDDLIPVYCSLSGGIHVAPIPLTDMEWVESGELVENVEKNLSGFADMVLVKCYGLSGANPRLWGGVDDGGMNYEAYNALYGSMASSNGSVIFPFEVVLYAHVNKIEITGSFVAIDRHYKAYRYKLR